MSSATAAISIACLICSSWSSSFMAASIAFTSGSCSRTRTRRSCASMMGVIMRGNCCARAFTSAFSISTASKLDLHASTSFITAASECIRAKTLCNALVSAFSKNTPSAFSSSCVTLDSTSPNFSMEPPTDCRMLSPCHVTVALRDFVLDIVAPPAGAASPLSLCSSKNSRISLHTTFFLWTRLRMMNPRTPACARRTALPIIL
mmetsp:Transcript_46097/g.109693  ORF Transcript_46097/g.109693 Transcript_46097/m.109693 type:complete len:204 (+) Transcript_46097:1463-2074(+)